MSGRDPRARAPERSAAHALPACPGIPAIPAVCLSLLLAACSARRGEPLKGALDISDPRVARGELVFMAKCNKCHPGGEGGLGPSLNNKPLPDFYVSYQARHGTGAMPAFDSDELPDQDLGDVSAYLKALRNNGSDGESGQGARKESTAKAVPAEGEEKPGEVR